jgi:hypothetical protein
MNIGQQSKKPSSLYEEIHSNNSNKKVRLIAPLLIILSNPAMSQFPFCGRVKGENSVISPTFYTLV